jgi:putative ABC transport system permease protein
MAKNRTWKDKSAVKKSILLSIAYHNLVHKRLRSGLTILGIAIGIGAIYFLLSFGLGLQNLVTSEVIGNQSIKTIDVVSPNSNIVSLDDVVLERIQNIENVEQVSRIYFYPASFKYSGSETDAIIYGIDKDYKDLTFLSVVDGSVEALHDKPNNALVNKALLDSIGIAIDSAVIGQTIDVLVPESQVQGLEKDIVETYTIVGVIDSGSGGELFVDESVFRKNGIIASSQVKIGSNDVEAIANIRTQIESYGLETTSPTDTLAEINIIFRYLNLLLVGFGGIGMIVAVLGMFNTLTISLLERTKEIGLMIALGARSIDIKLLFIFEAFLLSVAGSVIGVGGAYIFGHIVNFFMNIMASSRGVQSGFDLFSNPIILVLAVIVFMILIGLSVVFIPARRAQKINPITALRSE